MGVLDFFKKAMPFITTGLSLAGPAGTMAANVLGKTLGVNNPTITSVQDALAKLSLTPEIQAQLTQAEEQYKLQMQSMGYQHEEELASLADKDRDSARNLQIQTRSYTMPVLAFLAVGVLLACLYMIGFRKLPDEGHDAIMILIGIVGSTVKDVYGYFFGSSVASNGNTKTLP